MGRPCQFRRLILAGALAFALSDASQSQTTTDAANDWQALQPQHESVTRAEFERLLFALYNPTGSITNFLTFATNAVVVYSSAAKTNPPLYQLRFGAANKPAVAIHAAGSTSNLPLAGLRIALDPGHIGGEWGRMEERFFVRGTDRPVQEGVLNLITARLLRQRLQSLGASVTLTRDNFEPVTSARPEQFRQQARETILDNVALFDVFPPVEREAAMADAIRRRQEILFFRQSEIAARARLINDQHKPHLTLCIHFNAVEWNHRYELVEDNRLVVFIHGNYLDAELDDDAQKYRLFHKLLERTHPLELSLSEAIAESLASATGLPPVVYGQGSGAIRFGPNPYIYARNLAANRLINGPVIFLEPYYMNNRTEYQRIQMGDYEGLRDVDGKPRKSIYREYADAVADGLVKWRAAQRVR